MRQLGVTKSKNRLLTVLLAFILPGAGHLYIGHYSRGLLLMVGLLLDGAAIIQLADANGARHLLFIVYLGLALPVFYFFSVYDALQSLDRIAERPASLKISNGILIMVSGMLLLLLIKPPSFLVPWMNELADFAVGPLLISLALVVFIMYVRGEGHMFKLGRFTSALLIIVVGSLLLWDQVQGRNDIALLGQWWPVLFILLGAEVIMYSVAQRKGEKQLRLDFAGGILAIVIVVSAYTVTQYAELPFRWLDQYVDLNGTADYGEEKGFQYDKEAIRIPFDELTSSIKINNPNGKITVRSGDNDDVVIESEVWVDVASQEEADQIADHSFVASSFEGEKLSIAAQGQSFGTNGARKPRINMTVTIPRLSVSVEPEIDVVPDEKSVDQSNLGLDDKKSEERQLSIIIDANNGTIDTNGLIVTGGLQIKNVSGKIHLSDITGPVEVTGINGDIIVQEVTGNVKLSTKNGTLAIAKVTGELFTETINGSIDIEEAAGNIEADTKNGKIKIKGAEASIKANTMNGGIELSSSVIGGDWDVDSSVGEIKLQVPEDGDFSVYGSVTFGTITTDLPLTISKKTVRGTVGEGTYRIQINATNSISIHGNGL
ncbi:MAG: DUF4097 domain-containing protein [Candidatus Pristimantibacillus sp.]